MGMVGMADTVSIRGSTAENSPHPERRGRRTSCSSRETGQEIGYWGGRYGGYGEAQDVGHQRSCGEEADQVSKRESCARGPLGKTGLRGWSPMMVS